jgi:phytoene dehydrogenase-like protein
MGTLADVAARHFRTGAMRQFAGRFATYAGASPYAVSGAYALVPWVEHAYGVHHVRGGMGALVAALERALRRLGVTVHTGMRVGWRPCGSGFAVGRGRDGQWFDTVVVNADPTAGRWAPLTLSGYVMLLDVPERLALPHHTVVFSRDYAAEFAALFAGRVPDDATVYVCHPVATDPGMAPAGRSGVYVMMNLPPLARAPESWEIVAPRVRTACLARLDAVAPGAASRARVVGERTPLDLARLGAPAGAIYGFLPHGLLGPFRRPRMRGTPRGLFWAGGGTHPGGGVPLVMLSGRFAARMALEHVGVREAA